MSMIPIASSTVGAGGVSSVTFSNIPSTFTHLQLRIFARTNRSFTGNAVDTIGLLFNSSVYPTINHSLYGADNTAYSGTGLGSAFIASNTALASVFGVAVLDILDYANTNKNKTTRSISGFDNNFDSSRSGFVGISSGLISTLNAIDTINVYPTNGSAFLQYSRFDLYGITNSPATGA